MKNYNHKQIKNVFTHFVYNNMDVDLWNLISEKLIHKISGEKVKAKVETSFPAEPYDGSYMYLSNNATRKAIYGDIFRISINNMYPTITKTLINEKGASAIKFDNEAFGGIYTDIISFYQHLKTLPQDDTIMTLRLFVKKYINFTFGIMNSNKSSVSVKHGTLHGKIGRFVEEHIKPMSTFKNILYISTDEIYGIEIEDDKSGFVISSQQIIKKLISLNFEVDCVDLKFAMFDRLKSHVLIDRDDTIITRGYAEFELE